MQTLSDKAVISKEVRLYTLQKDDATSPAELLYRPLSYREVQSLFEMYNDDRGNARTVKAFELGVVGCSNIEGLHDLSRVGPLLVEMLPYSDILEVGHEILTLSLPTKDVYSTLTQTLEIGFDKALQSDTWKCSVCQEKRLDKTRNCPLLGNKTKDPTFRMYLKGKPHSYCIMADKDEGLMHKAMECHRMFEAGVLPDEGGFYDQTHFFIDATSIVKNRVQKAEIEAMHEVTNKKGKRR